MARSGSVIVLAAVAAVAVAGCGKSKEEKGKELIQSICNGFAPGTTTYNDAVQALEGGEFGNQVTACASNFVQSGTPPDVCAYGAGVCKVEFEFVLNDVSACPSSPAGPACWYFCELRFAEADMTQSSSGLIGLPNPDAKVCARLFFSSPFPAF
jgi:hypothetical protein